MSTIDTILSKEKLSDSKISGVIEKTTAIHEHEGVTPSDFSNQCSEKVLRGEMTSDQAVALIIKN